MTVTPGGAGGAAAAGFEASALARRGFEEGDRRGDGFFFRLAMEIASGHRLRMGLACAYAQLFVQLHNIWAGRRADVKYDRPVDWPIS
ncbi:MAG: hypothetical protein IT430_18045 [Phycisphaerales bacterium]|nr:hypothetical protein [Phycisphaerales bacterium]